MFYQEFSTLQIDVNGKKEKKKNTIKLDLCFKLGVILNNTQI